jgi:outer membrane PBP1 activator LpoA protein
MSQNLSFNSRPSQKKAAATGVDQLDSAGQTILQLLNKAANVAEQNSKHAIDMAQKLAHELRAAQQRISELEAEVVAYQNQAERAEQWLHKVSIQKLKIAFCSKGKAAREAVCSDGLARTCSKQFRLAT